MNLAAAPPRKEKQASSQRIKLLCPKCKHRMVDQREGVTSELHIMENGDKWPADYFLKCTQCKSEVGLRKIG